MIFCLDKVADALNRLYHGVEVDIGGKREMVRAMVTQYRGDWKFHRVSGQHLMDLLLHAVVQLQKNSLDFLGAKEWFNLQAWWKAVNICHGCFMTKSDFLVVPNPLIERPRRDLQSFLNDALRPGEQSSLDCKL